MVSNKAKKIKNLKKKKIEEKKEVHQTIFFDEPEFKGSGVVTIGKNNNNKSYSSSVLRDIKFTQYDSDDSATEDEQESPFQPRISKKQVTILEELKQQERLSRLEISKKEDEIIIYLKEQQSEKENESPDEDELDQINLMDVINEGQSIATVRKENLFSSEVTAEEQGIIQQRVALQQKQFREFEKRENIKKKKPRKIRSVHEYINEQEALYALKECKNDE